MPIVSSARDRMSAADMRRGVAGSCATVTAAEELPLRVFRRPLRSTRSVREPHIDVSGFRDTWGIHFAHSSWHLRRGISI